MVGMKFHTWFDCQLLKGQNLPRMLNFEMINALATTHKCFATWTNLFSISFIPTHPQLLKSTYLENLIFFSFSTNLDASFLHIGHKGI